MTTPECLLEKILNLKESLTVHAASEEKMQAKIDERFATLEEGLQKLLLAQTKQSGFFAGMWFASTAISTVIAFIINKFVGQP